MRLNRIHYKQSTWLLGGLLLIAGCIQSEERVIDNVRAAYARSQLALAYLRIADTDAAYYQVVLALQHAPQRRDIQLTAALYYQLVNQEQSAENYYLQAMAQDSTDLTSLILYTYFLCQTKRFSEAQQSYQQVILNLSEPWLRYLNQLNKYCLLQNTASNSDWIIPSHNVQLKSKTFNHYPVELFDLFIEIIQTSMN